MRTNTCTSTTSLGTATARTNIYTHMSRYPICIHIFLTSITIIGIDRLCQRDDTSVSA